MRVLIVDDHPVTRDGLRSALSMSDEIELVGEASTGEQAVDMVSELHPDVVFMDVRMPGMGGIEATRTIRANGEDAKIILFTVDESRAAVTDAIQSGVSGYLLKESTTDELVSAARLAMEGKAVIHPKITAAFILDMQTPADRTDTDVPLSKREAQILQMVAYGSSTRKVAEELDISPHTVKTHLERIFEKFGANDRAQAVAIAIRRGIVE